MKCIIYNDAEGTLLLSDEHPQHKNRVVLVGRGASGVEDGVYTCLDDLPGDAGHSAVDLVHYWMNGIRLLGLAAWEFRTDAGLELARRFVNASPGEAGGEGVSPCQPINP